MKAIPFRIPKEEDKSIRTQVDKGVNFYERLHYHQEIQITAIVKGQGVVYCGNGMHNFQERDVLIFGANAPHLLKNQSLYQDTEQSEVLANSLFFDARTFGGSFFDIKEMVSIRAVISESSRGILFRNSDLYSKVCTASKTKDQHLVLGLLDVLVELVNSAGEFIGGKEYEAVLDEQVGRRLNDVLTHTFANIQSRLNIEDIAAIANLSRSQFSRYFKLHTGKSYVRFVNEFRVESACRLLVNGNQSIEQICYQVGFQNVSNFNRQFRLIKDLSPRQFRGKLALGKVTL